MSISPTFATSPLNLRRETNLDGSYARRSLPSGLLFAESLEQAWTALARPDVFGVVWERSSPAWERVQADVGAHFHSLSQGLFCTGPLEHHKREVEALFEREGFAHRYPDSCAFLSRDICRLLDFVSGMTDVREVISGITWMHQDRKGWHVDSRTAVVCFVSYLGPGPVLASPDDISDKSAPVHLAPVAGSPVYHTPQNYVAFMKGRINPGEPGSCTNFGLPHRSPDPGDLVRGFERRLSFAIQSYGCRFVPFSTPRGNVAA